MKKIISGAIIIALFSFLINWTSSYRQRAKVAESNIAVLNDSLQCYKIRDSLNVAKIKSLCYTEAQLAKYKNDSYALIKELSKRASLQSVEYITTTKHDTLPPILIKDTVLVESQSAKYFDYKSKYTDVHAILYNDSAHVSIANREELIVVESKRKKRFLFFNLPGKIFGYKYNQINVTSKNPNTVISGLEFIEIAN